MDVLVVPPTVQQVLKQYWGFETLRPFQAEAIDAALQQRDSLVVLPTGGGKSLCYQVPAAVAGRTDVVVSPLISLMKDQVDGLRACGYPAAALHSGLSVEERRQTERELLAGRYRLLFVAPERLQNEFLLSWLGRIDVRAFAIDEAHCISHWGHDFRPEYRQLAQLRERFPQAALHAYTATATERVRGDILKQLCLRDPVVLVGSFDRPNLTYRVQPKQEVYGQVAAALARHKGEAAIVYCLSRADTEAMAAALRERRIRAAHYHAGLDAEKRHRTQEAFASEELDVVVATVAFGMGIDRSDVRCVIHAAVPKSLEHYQQETGRAGRDGLPAECVLFYSYSDVARWEGLIEKSAADAGAGAEVVQAGQALLRQIQRFCTATSCRHRHIVEYFGQTQAAESCGACDVCLDELGDVSDATVLAQKILSCVARVGQRCGVGHVAEVLMGSRTARLRELGHDQLSTYGLLPEYDKATLGSLIYQLVDQGVLARTDEQYPILRLNAASWEVMRGQRRVRLRQAVVTVRETAGERDSWAGVERELFEALRKVRLGLAQQRGIPPFTILHDATVRDLARFRPTSEEGLRQIRGMGVRKLADFGAQLLDCIRTHCQSRGLASDVLEVEPAPVHEPSSRSPGRGGRRRPRRGKRIR